MGSLTRLAFGMALAAAAPAASLLIMTYSHDAAAICSTIYGCGDNGPALTGTRFDKPWQGETIDAPEPHRSRTDSLELSGVILGETGKQEATKKDATQDVRMLAGIATSP